MGYGLLCCIRHIADIQKTFLHRLPPHWRRTAQKAHASMTRNIVYYCPKKNK